MEVSLKAFIQEIDAVRKALNKDKPKKQLHSQLRRDELRAIAEKYFNIVRPSQLDVGQQDPDVAEVDRLMQQMISLCHKKGAVTKYQSILFEARRGLIAVEARALVSPRIGDASSGTSKVDTAIIDTLEKLVPSAALSYRQALRDLETEDRLSWRGPATDLREALREVLDYLAPDADVRSMAGYKQEPNTNGPTMKQKVRYILKNRGVGQSAGAPTETATDAIEEAVGSFVRSVYTRSSVSTHTPTEKDEVLRVRDFVRVVMCELLAIRPE